MTIVGKKHWLKITLLVLAVCAVAGLVAVGKNNISSDSES